ncbi:MAG: peptidylprolyl isomerase [Waddliaceae bacterium]|jgi:peptidylprolyl isomerase|nr:peptidylprolyl isomerase [Waddliaceae bacterium]MBT3579574.1 peptidylprolyl isomerase [Waddliaceae bacterium]MBT4444436.1 peptidylprolyl isomerase [Waddliaceae bacterium]MBT6928181.1 peptidylprolyl isomerase [Waddliaceae bacterium]MBT7264326.1 peptidylprolyl isomerase [Waddliaceae bacterium]
MTTVKNGDTVKVHYTGTLEDGTVFDTSRDLDPLEFTIGSDQVILGFNDAVIGKKVGDANIITIPSEEAYGPYRDDMVIEVPKTNFPEDITPVIGQNIQLQDEDGNIAVAAIEGLTDETVTLNANHPLAGKDLTFDIELMEIIA